MTNNPRRKVDWTSVQDQTLIELRASNLKWNDIAETVGRSVEACCARYRTIVPMQERVRFQRYGWSVRDTAKLEQMLADGIAPKYIASQLRKTRSAVYSKIQDMKEDRRIHLERIPRVHVPERCLEDRNRRLNAERDLTSEFFGDPAPGQSALDKKRGTTHETASPRSFATHQAARPFPQGSPSPSTYLAGAQALNPSQRA